MRFREFKSVKEAIPAVTQKDLKAVSPNLLQMTKDLSGKINDKIATAVGKSPPDPKAMKVQVPPGIQQQMQVQPTAIQQAQQQAAQQAKPELAKIPTVGSQLVLPDKDTKKPASYTIKALKGNDITLDPIKNNPNDPRIDVTVKKKDLQNTLTALDPNNKVGTVK
jgi:hypothetical protein